MKKLSVLVLALLAICVFVPATMAHDYSLPVLSGPKTYSSCSPSGDTISVTNVGNFTLRGQVIGDYVVGASRKNFFYQSVDHTGPSDFSLTVPYPNVSAWPSKEIHVDIQIEVWMGNEKVATLGPSQDWDVWIPDHCQEKPKNNATISVATQCSDLTYWVTVNPDKGDIASPNNQITGKLASEPQDFDVTVVFVAGEPATQVLHAHVPAIKETPCQEGQNYAEPHVRYTCDLGLATIELTASLGVTSVTPDVPKTVALTNKVQKINFEVTFLSGTPNPVIVTAVIKDLKTGCKTKEVPPGNPDQGYCLVGNAMNVAEGTHGGFRGGWWLAAMHLMPTGKSALAIEMHFADYKNRQNTTVRITSGEGFQDVLIKTLDASIEDRCDVGNFVAIPFTGPEPLIMDEGDAGWMHGEASGTASVDGQPFTVEKFNAQGTVSQASGVLATVSTKGRTFYGWHYTDLQRELEVDAVIIIGKKTYMVKAVWEIEKNEILNLPKGVYGVSCTPDLVRNKIYQLVLVK